MSKCHLSQGIKKEGQKQKENSRMSNRKEGNYLLQNCKTPTWGF